MYQSQKSNLHRLRGYLWVTHALRSINRRNIPTQGPTGLDEPSSTVSASITNCYVVLLTFLIAVFLLKNTIIQLPFLVVPRGK